MKKSTTKPKYIILEGVDRVGKGTMQLAINKATNYKHIVVDRGPIGFLAYTRIFDKGEELYEEYVRMEKQLASLDNVLVIYLTADKEELIERCKKTNHEIINYDLHMSYYKFFLETSPLEYIIVDTTHQHVDEAVKELVEKGVL